MSLLCLPVLPLSPLTVSLYQTPVLCSTQLFIYCGKEDTPNIGSSWWIPSSKEDGYPVIMCSKFQELGNLGFHPFFATNLLWHLRQDAEFLLWTQQILQVSLC